MLCAQLSRGDITRHRMIYHGATLFEAALYARELGRKARVEEFHRQMLCEVINRSAGGNFSADRSLLRDEGPGPKASARAVADNWMTLAGHLGQEVPEGFQKKARALDG
jgi:hypothetical protein